MKKTDFHDVVEFCDKRKFFIGEGTPTAKILIIGKECGWNKDLGEPTPENIKKQAKESVEYNLKCWRNLNGNLEQLKKDALKSWPNNPTWRNYETLVKSITGMKLAKYDFLDYCFITELSQIGMPYSKHNDITKESVKKREELFMHSFFQNFPVVVMTCGHYPTQEYKFDIENIFDVEWTKETKVLSKANYYNVHHGKTKNGQDKILIHTRQVSCGVTNQLLQDIGKVIRDFLWRTDNDFRWNNGGKDIYEKFQDDPEFMQSEEYQNYMNSLK